jgi:hypothetical protein
MLDVQRHYRSFQIEPQLEHNFERFFPFTIFRDLYLVYVEQLPLYNPPDVLGLHSNAEINYLTQAAHDIWSNMLNIQPERDQGEDNASRERKIYKREGQTFKTFFLAQDSSSH